MAEVQRGWLKRALADAREERQRLFAKMRGRSNMDADRIAEIQAREAEATPGPWRRLGPTTRGAFTFGEHEIVSDAAQMRVIAWTGFDAADGSKAQKKRDAQFVSHARQDVPDLLAALEQAEERLTATENLLTDSIQGYKAASKEAQERERVLREALKKAVAHIECTQTTNCGEYCHKEFTGLLEGQEAARQETGE